MPQEPSPSDGHAAGPDDVPRTQIPFASTLWPAGEGHPRLGVELAATGILPRLVWPDNRFFRVGERERQAVGMRVEVVPAEVGDKGVVRRLMELYQYDFSEIVRGDVDVHGEFGYRYLDHYWTEADRVRGIIGRPRNDAALYGVAPPISRVSTSCCSGTNESTMVKAPCSP
jgi:hypothetical protein